MPHRFAAITLVLLLMGGCASKDFQEPGIADVEERETDDVFRGSYADVWTASVTVLDGHRYPLATAQKESGVIITDWVMGKSDRLFSGYGDTRIPYNIRFRLTMRFKPSRDGVKIAVTNEEEYLSDSITAGSDFSGSLYQWIPTESSTAKEGVLLQEVEAELVKLQDRTRGK